MQIQHERRGDVLIVTIEGRMDSVTTPRIDATLNGVVSGADDRVILDLSNVDFVNSAGLRLLLKVEKQLEATGALVLCGLQKPVQQVLELAGIGKLFVTEPSLPRALARLTPAT